MNIIKKMIFSFILLTLCLLLGFWALVKFARQDVLRVYLSQQLAAITHYKNHIDGSVSWRLFPKPGLKITDVSFEGENSAVKYKLRLHEVIFDLKISPLFKRQLVFNELNINGYEAYLSPQESSAVKLSVPSSAILPPTNQQLLAFDHILLSHGEVFFQNKRETLKLTDLQIGAEKVDLQKMNFPLQIKTKLQFSSPDVALSTLLRFKGSVTLPHSWQTLTSLQDLNYAGNIQARHFTLNKLNIPKINATLKRKPTLIQLNPLTLTLYNGESLGDLTYTLANKKLILNQTATNLAATKLSQDLLSKKAISGNLDFSLHAKADLNQEHWLSSTTCQGNVTIKQGVLRFIDFAKIIETTREVIHALLKVTSKKTGLALLQNHFANPALFQGLSHFNLLSMQYDIQGGMLHSDSLILQTDVLQMKGQGNLSLANQQIDGRLFATLNIMDKNINKIQQKLGGSFPILIQGNVATPIILPNLQIISPLLDKPWLNVIISKPFETFQSQLNQLLVLIK